MLDEAQEHEVLHLTLLVQLLAALLLLPDFLLLSLDLLLQLGSLLLSEALFLVALLLALGGSEVVSGGLLAALCRSLVLVSAGLGLLTWALSQALFVVDVFNAVVEASLAIVLIVSSRIA